jgi:hypothetical protein
MDQNEIIGIIGVVAAIIAIIAAFLVGRRSDQNQQKLARREKIANLCREVTIHLTTWHDALRAVVNGDDAEKFDKFRDSLDSFQAMKLAALRLTEFMGNKKFEGPLETYLATLEQFPECKSVVDAVNAFQRRALDFKEASWVSTLHDMVTGHGHWGETKIRNPENYKKEKEEGLGDIRAAYEKAISELAKTMADQARSLAG